MARKLRIEFSGAICHMINRSNYRCDLAFETGDCKKDRPDSLDSIFALGRMKRRSCPSHR